MEITEKALGPEHPDVGNRLNNLATVYSDLGRYSEAEPLYIRALEITEKALGPEHPDVGNRLNNLAGVYSDLGRYSEAEPLYNRALEITEKALGPEHPDVGTCLENLAIFLLHSNISISRPDLIMSEQLKLWKKPKGKIVLSLLAS